MQKKRENSELDWSKFSIGLILARFFNKRKENGMKLLGTRRVMDFLRARNKLIRPNNLKVSEWVDDYLDECLRNGKPVNILTPWSLSKAFEIRFKKQGNNFIPTKKEIQLFDEEIPKVMRAFKENGFRLNWWITFSRSYLDSRLISRELEDSYKNMIIDLARSISLSNEVVFLDLENDVLGRRSAPNPEVLNDLEKYVSRGAFEYDFQRWKRWAENEAEIEISDEELEQEVKYQIACEINEGRFLMSSESPFDSGNFIFIPLGVPERYDFFSVQAKEFRKRIVSILPVYPWRLQ